MCGFYGIFSSKKINLAKNVRQMLLEGIRKRGPDGSNFFHHSNERAIMVHTRLAIQDIKNGEQPFKGDKFVGVYNGEIYNHLSLRNTSLASKCNFKTRCDTETLFNLIRKNGVNKVIPQLNGMFSLAYYDLQNELLYLARDVCGQKPLYISSIEEFKATGNISFASDLKSLFNFNQKKSFDLESVVDFLELGYIRQPKSIFEGIQQICPGVVYEFNLKTREVNLKNISDWQQKEFETHFSSDKGSAHFSTLWKDVISDHLISDRPVGLFLSGGIDSSLIAMALKSLQRNNQTTAYCIGFKEDQFDESSVAEKVARTFGLDFKKHILDADEIEDLIYGLNNFYAEPYADESAIATLSLARLASKDTPVILSGDGGDECFIGYRRHIFLKKIQKYFGDTLVRNSLIPLKIFKRITRNPKLLRFWHLLNSNEDKFELYRALVKPTGSLGLINSRTLELRVGNDLINGTQLDNILEIDRKTYLVSDLMVKSDRACMSFGVENRSPFLDPRIRCFANNLPMKKKVNSFTGKLFLRNFLNSHTDDPDIWKRPKQGFGVPIGSWLKNSDKGSKSVNKLTDLKDIFPGLFAEKFFDKTIHDFQEGNDTLGRVIWRLFVLKHWIENSKNVAI